MLKKIIVLALTLVLLLSCVACSGFETAESKEIASKLSGKTFKGKVEFDYAEDWEVTWIFGESSVSVTVESKDTKGIPYSETKEYRYKVTGSYKNAKVEFPGSKNWNALSVELDADKNPRALNHTDSTGTSRFAISKK